MKMQAEPCKICGASDVNLVDGYYYCVECGTQDVNVRERIIEYAINEDGTFAYRTKKKIVMIDSTLNPDIMSLEWHKWHTYNFVLTGLVNEMVDLGAGESFKMKVLWVWSKYINRFKGRVEAMDSKNQIDIENTLGQSFCPNSGPGQLDETSEHELNDNINIQNYKISICTLATLISIIYIGLNIDESEIQVGDLCRFIREERLSIRNFKKFLPKELKYTKIDNWNNFIISKQRLKSPKLIRKTAMSLFKELDLGVPLCPNIHKLVNRYLIELCMPLEFQAIVFSIMDYVPIKLDVDDCKILNFVPDYEGLAMSYILTAFKMSFGLDDQYECNLSEAASQINLEKKHAKCYKTSMFMEFTNRLFTFRDWSSFMEYRKLILCKHFFPLAIVHEPDIVEDVEFISFSKDRHIVNTEPRNLSEELLMEILNKLIPRDDLEDKKLIFPPSLTPYTTYTEVLLNQSHDPNLIENLNEDFSSYSLKYITHDFKLEYDLDNVFTGISLNNKHIVEKLTTKCLYIPTKTSQKVVTVINSNEHWVNSKLRSVKFKKNDNGMTAEIQMSIPNITDDDNNSEMFEDDNTVSSSSINMYDRKIDIEECDISSNIASSDYHSDIINASIDRTSISQLDNEETTLNNLSNNEAISFLLNAVNSRFNNLNNTFPLSKKRNPGKKNPVDSTLNGTKVRRKTIMDVPLVNEEELNCMNESLSEYLSKFIGGDDTSSVSTVLLDDTDQQLQQAIETMDSTVFDETNNIECENIQNMETTNEDETVLEDLVTLHVDVPLSALSEIRKSMNGSLNRIKQTLPDDKNEMTDLTKHELCEENEQPQYESLVSSNIDNINRYYYWLRHYNRKHLKRNCPQVFESDLTENFPRSFAWLIRFLAAMVESTSLQLYEQLTFLEENIKTKLNSQREFT